MIRVWRRSIFIQEQRPQESTKLERIFKVSVRFEWPDTETEAKPYLSAACREVRPDYCGLLVQNLIVLICTSQ